MNTLASRVLHLRKAVGLTQTELATRVGLSQGDISKIEAGATKETTKVAQLAQVLGVDAFWLATGISPAAPSLRDYFAAHAMQGASANPRIEELFQKHGHPGQVLADWIAPAAYVMADAMLAARSK